MQIPLVVPWHELSEEERKAVRNPTDCPIISVIDGLSPEDRGQIYNSIKVKPNYYIDFAKTQKAWMEDLCWYMGQKLKKDVRNCKEFLEEINGAFHERFRLYYAAKNPNNIEIIKVNQKTLEFLLEVEEVIKIKNPTDNPNN